MEYSVIVFDTAPTGHTLRFLSFPTVLEKALGKLSALSGRIGPMISQMTSLMGGQADAPEDMFAKLESMRAIITEVNTQFKDPVRLRFVNKPQVLPGLTRTRSPYRRRLRSYAYAFQSSCRCMRRSGWCKNSLRMRSTRTILLSTSSCSPNRVRTRHQLSPTERPHLRYTTRLELRALSSATQDATEVSQRSSRALRRVLPHRPAPTPHRGSSGTGEAQGVQQDAHQTVRAPTVDRTCRLHASTL